MFPIKCLNSVNEMKNFGNMVGFGYTPEGIGRNYVLVDLLTTIALDLGKYLQLCLFAC